MALTTIAKIRLISDLSTSDISDVDLDSLITEATRQFWKDISVRVEWDTVDGNIDGSNKEYRVIKYPICATSESPTVVPGDIQVYSNNTNATTGFEETSELTVSTVYANDGRFVLSSALANDIDEIRCNYAYTGYWIDWDKVSLAVAYLTSYLAYGGKFASGETQSVKFKDLAVTQSSSTGGNEDGQAGNMLIRYAETVRSLLPRRFADKKVRTPTILSQQMAAAKKR